MHIGTRMVLATVFLMIGAQARADDKEDLSVTQVEVIANTITEKAPGETEAAVPPTQIHPLNEAERDALKDTNHRVVSGKRWKSLTPQQRDELIRNLRKTNAPGTIFVIDVRTGAVYKFDPLPPTEDKNAKDDERLREMYKVNLRFFTPVDLTNLPVAVLPDDGSDDDTGESRVVRGPPARVD